MRFDLADLRLFVSVLRAGSITRGAQEANLALASASQRISGMEATLGVPLLERVPRGVRPTPAGLVLLRHAKDILSRAERMQGDLRDFANGARGRIRLLSNTGALLGFLPHALRSFLLAHPGLDIDIEERPSTEIVRIVAEGAAELGIFADVVDAGALQVYRLVEDRLVVLMPATHRLAGGAQVDFIEIAREKFIGLLDAALQAHLAEHAMRRGIRLEYRIRLRSIRPIGRMVEDGVGIAILPESTAAELGSATLRVVPLADAWARRRLALCLRSREELTPHARLLLQHMTGGAAASGW